MTQERTPDVAAEEVVVERPHSFPVPRNRPQLVAPPVDGEEDEGEDEPEPVAPSWERRALQVLLVTALAAVVTGAWLVLRPKTKPPASPVVETREPTGDPAVETYFTPSQPAVLPPVEEDTTPLPVQPVSLDDLFGKEER